jgi:hypothetical protein
MRTITTTIPATWAGVARPCADAGYARHLMVSQVNAKPWGATVFARRLPRQPT